MQWFNFHYFSTSTTTSTATATSSPGSGGNGSNRKYHNEKWVPPDLPKANLKLFIILIAANLAYLNAAFYAGKFYASEVATSVSYWSVQHVLSLGGI
jgi:hypothetical protein